MNCLNWRSAIMALLLCLLLVPSPAVFAQAQTAGNVLNINLATPLSDEAITFVLGGVFQTDYRYYMNENQDDNRFLIRRAQLELTGYVRSWLKLNLEYEFKNDVNDHLMDTFAEIEFNNQALRIGHFKKPFGLEWQTPESAIFFAERSMGYYLTPHRDVGLALGGSLLDEHLFYAGGLFNAEGENVTNRGDGNDDPEALARIVAAPFSGMDADWLRQLQFGGSASWARINLSNLDVEVKTTGMVGTSRNIFVLSHDTKFGVLQEADKRLRYGAEAAWAYASLALQAEFIHLTYTDLKPATGPARDADFSNWYASAIYFPTGEALEFVRSVPERVVPLRPFNPSVGGWGALGLALRYSHFNGDEDWIQPGTYVSVADADAWSLAINWILLPMHRIVLDYTHTDLSDPIRVRVHPDGSVDYINDEEVLVLRYSIDF